MESTGKLTCKQCEKNGKDLRCKERGERLVKDEQHWRRVKDSATRKGKKTKQQVDGEVLAAGGRPGERGLTSPGRPLQGLHLPRDPGWRIEPPVYSPSSRNRWLALAPFASSVFVSLSLHHVLIVL